MIPTIPCPPSPYGSWFDVPVGHPQRALLRWYEDRVREFLAEGSRRTRFWRRRNLWVQAKLETARSFGADV